MLHVSLCGKKMVAAVAVIGGLVSSAMARDPQFAEYYIGRDLRTTIPSGTYEGLANPNFNRITFLYAHSFTEAPATNHYHAKSPYTYFGSNLGASTTVQPYNGNAAGLPTGNFLPEGAFGNSPRLQLLPGSGAFAGKWISGLAGQGFGDLNIKSVDSLAAVAGTNSAANTLFRSGGTTPVNRWTGSMAGTNLTLELVNITPGFEVANTDGTTILDSAGDQIALGSGGINLDFTPVFVATSSTFADYSATFKLIDTSSANGGNAFGESGQFVFNSVVPEPTSLALIGIAGVALLRRRGR
jgi:hypothetical protein